MVKLFVPILLLSISVIGFLFFTNPLYKEIGELKADAVAFDEALNNSKALENERDKLTKKYNTIDTTNLSKLEKMLPESVDNIRLILEIEQIAQPYGMVLKDVQYDTTKKATSTPEGETIGGGMTEMDNRDYGIWELRFSTTGSYDDFISLLKDLEKNLRIVDISNIGFSSGGVSLLPENYQYDFTIKTYWLKN